LCADDLVVCTLFLLGRRRGKSGRWETFYILVESERSGVVRVKFEHIVKGEVRVKFDEEVIRRC
jgi:hypothetical protein